MGHGSDALAWVDPQPLRLRGPPPWSGPRARRGTRPSGGARSTNGWRTTELLARIADNFHPSRRWGDEAPQPYDGLYALLAIARSNPTLPPIPYRDLTSETESEGETWRPPQITLQSWPPVPIDFARYHGDPNAFVADHASESTLDRLLILKDTQDVDWVVLDGLIEQGDPTADESWRGMQQAVLVDTWLVHKSDAPAVMAALPNLRKADHHSLVDSHGHVDCCYAGEVGWVSRRCPNLHADFEDVGSDEQSWPLAKTVETVAWEGSVLDCSIKDTVSSAMPSTFIQQYESLVLDERGRAGRTPAARSSSRTSERQVAGRIECVPYARRGSPSSCKNTI